MKIKTRVGTAIKKPIQVKAYHLGTIDEVKQAYDLIRNNSNETVTLSDNQNCIHIQKEYGWHSVELGSWILYELNTDKKFWGIKPDIFNKTYNVIDTSKDLYEKSQLKFEYCFLADLESLSIKKTLRFIGYVPNNPLEYLQLEEMVQDIQEQGGITINTLEGSAEVKPNMYIMKGVLGELYPVYPMNFNKVYIDNN